MGMGPSGPGQDPPGGSVRYNLRADLPADCAGLHSSSWAEHSARLHANGASTPGRHRTPRGVWIALALLVLFHLAGNLLWYSLDESEVPDRGHPHFEIHIAIEHYADIQTGTTSGLDWRLLVNPGSRGIWHSVAAFAAHSVGGSVRSLRFAPTLLFLAALIFTFLWGRWISGPWVGLLAAGLLSLSPAYYLQSRTYDIHALQAASLTGAMVLFHQLTFGSRRRQRVGGLVGAAVVLYFAGRGWQYLTDNLALMLAAGSAAVGCVLAWSARLLRRRRGRGTRGFLILSSLLLALPVCGLLLSSIPGYALKRGSACLSE